MRRWNTIAPLVHEQRGLRRADGLHDRRGDEDRDEQVRATPLRAIAEQSGERGRADECAETEIRVLRLGPGQEKIEEPLRVAPRVHRRHRASVPPSGKAPCPCRMTSRRTSGAADVRWRRDSGRRTRPLESRTAAEEPPTGSRWSAQAAGAPHARSSRPPESETARTLQAGWHPQDPPAVPTMARPCRAHAGTTAPPRRPGTSTARPPCPKARPRSGGERRRARGP